MANSIDNFSYGNVKTLYANYTDEDIINKYAELTNQNVESVQYLVDNEITTVETLKDAIISEEVNKQAFEQAETNLGKLAGYKNHGSYDLVASLIASDGDQSSYNAWNEEQLKQWEAAYADEGIKKILNTVLGDDFADTVNAAVTHDDYSSISRANRYAAHDTAAGLQAQSIISEEGFDEKEMEAYTERLIENNKALEEYEGIAKLAAAVGARLNKGLEALQENFHDNAYAIKNADKNSKEYSDAMEKMKEAVADVVNAEEDMLSDEFIVQHLGDIEKAANGDVQAIEDLQAAAAKDIIINLDVSDDIKNELSGLHDEIWNFTNS